MEEFAMIVIIVILCCVMFLAWLITMATCPDAMVNFLSGPGTDQFQTNSSRESRELIEKNGSSSEDIEMGETHHKEPQGEITHDTDMVRSISGVLDLNRSARRISERNLEGQTAEKILDKKLSVVEEQDEQLTMQSTIHSGGRPSILKHPMTQVVIECHPETMETASNVEEL